MDTGPGPANRPARPPPAPIGARPDDGTGAAAAHRAHHSRHQADHPFSGRITGPCPSPRAPPAGHPPALRETAAEARPRRARAPPRRAYASPVALRPCSCRATSAIEPERDGYTVKAFAICSTVRLLSTAIEMG